MIVGRILEDSAPLTNTHSGREKMARFLQYFLTYLAKATQDKNEVEKSRALEKMAAKMLIIKANMSLTRKVMRFGMQIPIALNIAKRFEQHKKEPVKYIYLQTLADIFGALFFCFDHPMYFVNTGFIKNWTDKRKQLISWLCEIWWLL